jgi:CspA family cold shock protein
MTVKWFNDAKSFGFIAQQGGDEGLCVRADMPLDTLREGQKVVFEVTRLSHRPPVEAHNVVFVSAASVDPPQELIHTKSAFLDGALSQEQRDVAWGVVAAALRATVPLDKDTRPLVPFIAGRTRLRELLAPFASDFDNLEFRLAKDDDGARREAAALFKRVTQLLEENLSGHRSKFPFGEIEVDANGRVRSIVVKRTEASDPQLAAKRGPFVERPRRETRKA